MFVILFMTVIGITKSWSIMIGDAVSDASIWSHEGVALERIMLSG